MNVYQRYLKKGDPTYYGRFTAPDPDRPGHNKPYLRQLGTTNREHALRLLKNIVKAAHEGRWDELEKTKARHDSATFGQLFTVYRLRFNFAKKTAANNISALRAILRRGLPRLAEADDATIDQENTSLLTATLMADFQAATRATSGDDNLARDSAAVTANSYRRQARSLFRPDLMSWYKDLHLPNLTGFLAVRPLPEPSKYFRAPAPELITKLRASAGQLRDTDPNTFRIYLLSFTAGMRRREIAHARWDWVETIKTDDGQTRHQIHIQTTTDFRPKSKRDRLIPLEPIVHQALEALRTPRIDSQPEYILTGHVTERYDKSFDRFSAWMQGIGFDQKKQAHLLRKMYGSYVTAQAGISAAQDLLGHSDISVTKQYYVAPLSLPQIRILG